MTNPSAIIIATIFGFFNDIINGWVKLNDATIIGEGFTVEFYRLFERTIDRNCDALNGWYSFKTTKFLMKLTIDGETKELMVTTENDADKLFEIFKSIETVDFGEDGIMTAKEIANTKFEAIKAYI